MFLPLFHDFPQLVRENISPLVQFFFGLIVLSEVRIFIGEIVEGFDKILEDFLFGIEAMKEFKEMGLNCRALDLSLFSMQTDILESSVHLSFVVDAQVLPDFEKYGSEVFINIITAGEVET